MIYMAVGGVNLVDGFFGTISGEIGAFFGAILTPGGREADVISSTVYFVKQIFLNGISGLHTNIVGILWIWVPGTVAAFVAGRYFSWESAKDSFWGTILSVFVLNLFILIIIFVPSFGILQGNPIANTGIAQLYYTNGSEFFSIWNQMTEILVYAFLNSLVFGGISAASSNVL